MYSKKIKMAISLTTVGTLFYAMYITYLNLKGLIPEATNVLNFYDYFYEKNRIIELPFNLSVWFDLLIGPAIIGTILYWFNLVKNTEKRAPTDSRGLQDKQLAHSLTFGLPGVFMSLALCFPVLMIIFKIIYSIKGDYMEMEVSLLHGFLTGMSLSLFLMTMFAPMLGFIFSFSDILDHEDKRSLFQKFNSKFTHYLKIGIIFTLPLLVGMLLAFMVRILISGVIEFLKIVSTIRITRKKMVA